MQQTAVLPNFVPTMRPSVLVSSSGHWVFWAVGAVRFEGDAAGRCLPDVMSHNAALLYVYLHFGACEVGQMAAGLGAWK